MQVKLLVRPAATYGWLWTLLSWLALGGGVILTLAIVVSGARLVVDPDGSSWLKTLLPQLGQAATAAPQSLDEIRQEMGSEGLVADTPLPWPDSVRPEVWLFPGLSAETRTIQTIWVYKPHGSRFQQIDRVTIPTLQESFVTAPLIGTASQVTAVDTTVPVARIQRLSGDFPWLLLSGQQRYGSTILRYGQVLGYRPRERRLTVLLRWSSPAGLSPQWLPGTQYLMVDQTVGLRPKLQLYRTLPGSLPRLEEVSFYGSVYGTAGQSSLYDKALRLATGEVWFHSLQMMESAKAALGAQWNDGAQAQLELIRLHSQRSKAQAERHWSNQQQQILAYLVAGRWDSAWSVLEKNPALYAGLLQHLEQDFDALWRSTQVHLQIHSQDTSALTWAALLVASRQSTQAAADWLKQRSDGGTALDRFQSLVRAQQKKSPQSLANSESAENSRRTTSSVAQPYQQLLGWAEAVDSPGTGWMRSHASSAVPQGQRWYLVEVQQLADGSTWQAPVLEPSAFWSRSQPLRNRLRLQTGHALVIHDVRAQGGRLQLLASGPQIERQPAAVFSGTAKSLSALAWQSASGMPPAHASGAAASAKNLQAALLTQLGLAPEQWLQLAPYLQYASSDITGDGETEHLYRLTAGTALPSELAASLAIAQPALDKTVILDTAGAFIYGDFKSPETALTAVVPGPSTILMQTYQGRQRLLWLGVQ